MSENSPLFVSCMELIAHSIDLYTEGNSKKYKFVILHLSNAIELILKDKVIDTGQSIYKDSKTISIWDCFKALELKGIFIKERPIIELLIDDRNTIQHRFGFPNPETVFFYLTNTLEYFKRFIDKEYSLDIIEILRLHTTEEKLEIVGLVDNIDSEEKSLIKLYQISPESAVLYAYNLIEEKLTPFLSGDSKKAGKKAVMLWHHSDFRKLINEFSDKNFIAGNAYEKFQILRQARNIGAHSQHYEKAPEDFWKESFEVAVEFINAIKKAKESGELSKTKNQKT